MSVWVDEGSVAFLQQAYRNNWQRYLVALGPGAELGWDICVLTASDGRQADMYRRQLAWRREAHLLPARTDFRVIPDPGGQRIGSGGATLRVLRELGDHVSTKRTLIIHSGGDSKRLPHCSAVGKLFARLPRELPDGRASTIFDEFLISLSGLAGTLPTGVLVASGDVLLIFDHLQLGLRRKGVTGVAAAAPAEMGTHHGVYVSEPDLRQVRAYLHKPSFATMSEWGAMQHDGAVQIDTGLVWLDGGTAARYADLLLDDAVAACAGDGGAAGPLNLYGDLLLPLAQSTAYERYLADESDGPATAPIQAARAAIWQRLRGVPFAVERLQPSVFGHFGTSREYWEMVAAEPDLRYMCGWTTQAAAWAATTGQKPWTLINAVVEGPVQAGQRPALIMDSHLSGGCFWRGACLIAGLRTETALTLGEDLVLHQLPVAGGYVTRLYGLHDDPKLGLASGTYLNQPWAEWLAEAGLSPSELWQGEPGALWEARLYLLAADREESLRLSLPLQDPTRAPAAWLARWRAAERLSLAESYALAVGQRILADAAQVEDQVAVRRYVQAVQAERPASDCVALLGSDLPTRQRRSQLVEPLLWDGEPTLPLRGCMALAQATESPQWGDQAFHALAQMIRGTLAAPAPAQPASRRQVRVEAAARIDFGGGWTDTPPYSIERGGTVLNAAITLRGQWPIVAQAEWLPEPALMLACRDIDATLSPRTVGELLDYANPADPFALLKAALVMRGIVSADLPPQTPIADVMKGWGGGLRLSTMTSIPRGSGLGTSSILAGAVLMALARWLDDEPIATRLVDEVLALEQMLTTGGGWQDQVGGLIGGLKLNHTAPGLPQRVQVTPVSMSEETSHDLASRLLVVYTGQQRLAKDLLRAVMGRWMARDPEMVAILAEIGRLAQAMAAALEKGNLDGFGALIAEHWTLNKRMDPGCTNPFIDRLFEVMAPHVCGAKVAGAGGGGFAIALARDAQAARRLPALLKETYTRAPVAVWPSAIPQDAMRVRETSCERAS